MRGTPRVGSLLRVFLGAAFLCVAWVLLTSTQADAAERPAPVELIASVAEPMTASVAAAPAQAPVLKESEAVVSDTAEPVVEQLRTTTAASADVGAAALKAVVAAVPMLEAPVVAVADDVVALADALPVVGREPVVNVPLPGGPTTPAPVQLPETDVLVSSVVSNLVAKSIAKQRDPLSSDAPRVAHRGLALAAFDCDVRVTGTRSAPVNELTPLGSGAPKPPEPPEPWPSPQSSMPPTHSAPSQGGGASCADLASIDPAVLLPHPTAWGPGSSNWRVPRGLPAQPGLRPD